MNLLLRLPFIKVLTFLLLPHILLGQDDDQSSGGSESAAEASVSGSASKKAIGAPEASESSPAINVAKAGLSVSQILTISTDKLRAVTQSGSATELKSLVSSINSGAADLSVVADIAVSSKASGGKIKLTEVKDRAEIVQVYVKSGLSGDDLVKKIAELKNPSAKFVKSEAKEEAEVVTKSGSTSSLAFYNSLKNAGLSNSEINIVVDAYKSALPEKEDELKTFTDKVVKALTGEYSLLKEVSVGTLDQRGEFDAQGNFISNDEKHSLTINEVVVYNPDILSFFTAIEDADQRIGLFHLLSTEFSNSDITEVPVEITTLAELLNLILNDINLSGNSKLSDLLAVDLDYIADKKPAKLLLDYLVQHNIINIGLKDELPENLLNIDSGKSVYANSDVTEFARYLSDYTTTRGLSEDHDLEDYKVPLENITLFPGKNIELSGNLDAKGVLDKANLTNNNVEPSDIRIAIIAAANDVTISNDLTIENDNQVEDHVLAIAAADDLVVKEGTKIKYEGSNLALASGDTMWLHNVEIETGGNIAIGTLNDLSISGTIISAGGGGNTPNKDIVLLYANDYLNINNVDFSDGIREIHLDAQRVAMRNMDLGDKFIRINTGSEIKWIIDGAFSVHADNILFTDTEPQNGEVVFYKIRHDAVDSGNRDIVKDDFSKVLPTN